MPDIEYRFLSDKKREDMTALNGGWRGRLFIDVRENRVGGIWKGDF